MEVCDANLSIDLLELVRDISDMQIDFNQSVKNINGEEFKNQGETVTLKTICVESLLSPELNKNKSGKDKMLTYGLAKRIHDGAEAVEVSAEELAKIVDMVGQNYPPGIVGPACELLQK